MTTQSSTLTDTKGHAGFIGDTSVFELVQASIFSIIVPRCRSRCDGQDFFLLHGTKFLFETHWNRFHPCIIYSQSFGYIHRSSHRCMNADGSHAFLPHPSKRRSYHAWSFDASDNNTNEHLNLSYPFLYIVQSIRPTSIFSHRTEPSILHTPRRGLWLRMPRVMPYKVLVGKLCPHPSEHRTYPFR